MKSVLISIQPKYCELIASGKKTVEVRKAAPKLETPFKCYIYCTKSNGYMYRCRLNENRLAIPEVWNGKVIGEFVCDEITTLNYDTDCSVEPPQEGYFFIKTPSENVLLDFNPCLTNKEFIDYGNGKPLYSWHISDLKIYDKPKELGEFKRVKVIRGYHKKDESGVGKLLHAKRVQVNYFDRPPHGHIAKRRRKYRMERLPEKVFTGKDGRNEYSCSASVRATNIAVY